MIDKDPLSIHERRERVLELRKEAQALLTEADRIQKGIDSDEDLIWQAALKAKKGSLRCSNAVR